MWISQRALLRNLVFSWFFLTWLLEPAAAVERQRVAETAVSVGIGFEYATGDFGSDTNTDFVTVPFSVTVAPNQDFAMELVIPFVYQSNSSNVYGATMPYRTSSGNSMSKTTGKRFISGPGGQTNGTGGSSFNPDDSQSGIGDISLTGDYRFLEQDEWPELRATLYMKFPTADEDKGLGTGEFDIGPGLAASSWYDDWHLILEGSYIFQGDSDLYATKDYLSYNGGVGYQFSRKFYGALMLYGATEPAKDSPEPLEGRIRFRWRFAEKMTMEGYGAKGFSDGSPDLGAGISIYYDF